MGRLAKKHSKIVVFQKICTFFGFKNVRIPLCVGVLVDRFVGRHRNSRGKQAVSAGVFEIILSFFSAKQNRKTELRFAF